MVTVTQERAAMTISARRLCVGEATFDLGARTVVVATVAPPQLDAQLAAADDADADVVLVATGGSADGSVDSTLGATIERVTNRTSLPVVVEVSAAAAVMVALGAGAGGVAVADTAIDGAYRDALGEGGGALFLRTTAWPPGSSDRRAIAASTAGLAPDRVAIEPGPLRASQIAAYTPPTEGAEVLVLSSSDQPRTRRLAALALGVGRGWPLVRLDEAPPPPGRRESPDLVAAVRVIRMIDAIRAAAADPRDRGAQ